MICPMLLDLPGAPVAAIVADYPHGWRGARASSSPRPGYDADPESWRECHQPATDPEDLERQLADRIPALRDWIRSFDTAAYLASIGLARRDIDTLKALLLT